MTEPRINLLENTPPDEWKQPIPPPRKPYKRWLALALGIVVLFLVIKVTFFPSNSGLGYSSTLLHPSKTSLIDSVKNYFFNSGSVLEGQKNDRVNILLLGIGGSGHDGPYLSDTNLILSMKPSTGEVALVSIPRDLTVDLPGYGWRKINNADAFGEVAHPGEGGDYARQIFEKTFNIPIPYYLRIDFSAFREIIDTVGGVTVDVPKSFTDSQFPGMNTDYADNTSYQTVTFTAGTETMNGVRALQFARSRHGNNGEGSDFARARRQQLVIDALKKKLLSSGTFTNPATIQSIWNSLNTRVATNMNLGEILYLASVGKDYRISKTLVLDNRPGGFLVDSIGEGGAYILSPVDGNFSKINDSIQNIFSASTTLGTVAMDTTTNSVKTPAARTAVSLDSTSSPKVEVQNGTWRAGVAGKLGQDLTAANYTVLSISNAFKRPVDKTAVYIINPKLANVAKNLSERINAPVATVLPEWLQDGYTSPEMPSSTLGTPKYNKSDDFLIILGSDYSD